MHFFEYGSHITVCGIDVEDHDADVADLPKNVTCPSCKGEPIHFAPWGSYKTSCGLEVPKGLVGVTDRRSQTTCTDCSSHFRFPEGE